MTVAGMACVTCGGSDQDLRLHKCQICFKWTCEKCGVARYGRMFESEKCANAFFFGDDDDSPDDY